MDQNGVQHHEAWITFNSVPFDPNNITANLYNMDDIGFTCNWLLRAEIRCCSLPPDCNGNQIPDECDIGVEWGGYCATPGANCFPPECSSDWDHNGVPDECECEDGCQTIAGDLNGDGTIDLADFAILTSAWFSEPGDAQWDPDCDISTPKNNVIDTWDLAVLCGNWLVDAK